MCEKRCESYPIKQLWAFQESRARADTFLTQVFLFFLLLANLLANRRAHNEAFKTRSAALNVNPRQAGRQYAENPAAR